MPGRMAGAVVQGAAQSRYNGVMLKSFIRASPIMPKAAVAGIIMALLLSGCGRPPKQSAKDRLRVQGSQLATFNGCDRCHEETGYILGPSWRQIAKRYKGNPNARRILIGSIKNGSADKWTAMTGGQRMPALGARVSDKDTRIIVNYILSFAE